jgi:hypothetical protein
MGSQRLDKGSQDPYANAKLELPLPWCYTFIEKLRKTRSVTLSHQEAGVSRQRAYQVRDKDANFRKAWEDALVECDNRMEETYFERALHGWDEDKVFLNRDGEIVRAPVRKFSPQMMGRWLEAKKPTDGWRPTMDVALSSEEAAAKVREFMQQAQNTVPKCEAPDDEMLPFCNRTGRRAVDGICPVHGDADCLVQPEKSEPPSDPLAE